MLSGNNPPHSFSISRFFFCSFSLVRSLFKDGLKKLTNHLQGKVFQKLCWWNWLGFGLVAASLFDALSKIGKLIDNTRMTGRRPKQTTT
jgi:hypothetical protein